MSLRQLLNTLPSFSHSHNLRTSTQSTIVWTNFWGNFKLQNATSWFIITVQDTCSNLSPEDISEKFWWVPPLYNSKIWKLWWVGTENGESMIHIGYLQGSLNLFRFSSHNKPGSHDVVDEIDNYTLIFIDNTFNLLVKKLKFKIKYGQLPRFLYNLYPIIRNKRGHSTHEYFFCISAYIHLQIVNSIWMLTIFPIHII